MNKMINHPQDIASGVRLGRIAWKNEMASERNGRGGRKIAEASRKISGKESSIRESDLVYETGFHKRTNQVIEVNC